MNSKADHKNKAVISNSSGVVYDSVDGREVFATYSPSKLVPLMQLVYFFAM